MVELINKKVVSNGLFSETVRTAIGVFPKKIDLKRDFYRIPEQILTGLYWFYKEVVEKENVDTQNCAQIISKLYESKVFSEELKNKFSFLINLATKFRLRQQYDFKGDCHSIYFDEEAWYKELQELDNKLSQSQEKLNKWESLYKKNQDSSKEYFEEKKNYKKFLKERAYLEKLALIGWKRKKIRSFLKKDLKYSKKSFR